MLILSNLITSPDVNKDKGMAEMIQLIAITDPSKLTSVSDNQLLCMDLLKMFTYPARFVW